MMLAWPDDADAIRARIARLPAEIKFVLKTKNEVGLLDRWIVHHMAIAGPEGLIVFDNDSTDPAVGAVLERYAGRVQCYRWSLRHNAVHASTQQRGLYDALRESCRHYAFLDTDEKAYWSDGVRLFEGTEAADFLRALDDRAVHPGLWLPNRPGSTDVYAVGEARMRHCLRWGKPLLGSAVDVEGFVNHNWQFVAQNPGYESWSGFVVCHDRFDDPERRVRTNVEKCLAYGFATSEEEIDRIVAAGDVEVADPSYRNYLHEIVRCRRERWNDAAAIGADQVRVGAGGRLEFGSPEAAERFRRFVSRRRIPEDEILAGA